MNEHEAYLREADIAVMRDGMAIAMPRFTAAADEIKRLETELDDWRECQRNAMREDCGDEKHCTCVPLLRKAAKDWEAEVERLQANAPGKETWVLDAHGPRHCKIVAVAIDVAEHEGFADARGFYASRDKAEAARPKQ